MRRWKNHGKHFKRAKLAVQEKKVTNLRKRLREQSFLSRKLEVLVAPPHRDPRRLNLGRQEVELLHAEDP